MIRGTPLKILILTFYYSPDLSAGSFRATALISELKKLTAANDTIDIVTTMPNRYHSFAEPALRIEAAANVTINRIQLPAHKSGMIDQSKAFALFAFKTLKNVRMKKYDVVFATSSRLFTGFLGAVTAKQKNAKFYLDLRDIFTDTLDSLLKNQLLSCLLLPFLRKIEKFTVQRADKINLVSEGFTGYFKNMIPQHKFSFFTNGIDEEFLNYDFSKKEPTEKKIILYAGNIGEGQGLEKIIPYCAKALEQTYEFWVIGDGGAKSKLEKTLAAHEATNVRLMPPVNRKKLLHLYTMSDCLFLHLNDHAAFKKVLPSKIFEYAATNKPIIAGVSGYAKEFIEKRLTKAAVFRPCDPEDFKAKFVMLNISKPEDDRSIFISTFRRTNIMRNLAKDILSCYTV